jgi:hypothetical protein
MGKNVIRLNESQLKNLVKECIKKVLKEDSSWDVEASYYCIEPKMVIDYLGLTPYVQKKGKELNWSEKDYAVFYDESADAFYVKEIGTCTEWDSYFDENSGWAYDSGENYEPEDLELDEETLKDLLTKLGVREKYNEIVKELEECFCQYKEEWWQEFSV